MRLATLGAAAVLAVGLTGRPAAAAPKVSGDYLEARSCNVYIGACHAEGERTTAGRHAVMAWKVREGSHKGITLDGVTAIALVTAEANLGESAAKRRAVIYVDSAATCAQKAAMAKMLQERAGTALGTVVAVKEAPISFSQCDKMVQVSAPGVATVKVKKETGTLCCLQNYEVWYRPFVSLKDGKLGYSVVSQFNEAALATNWATSDQNNAYFGQFGF